MLVDKPLSLQLKIGDLCHSRGIKFIASDSWGALPAIVLSCVSPASHCTRTWSVLGVFGKIFVDCGENFEVTDTNGEEPLTSMLATITQENPGVVTVVEDSRHGLETGDYVRFIEVMGMDEINQMEPQQVKVTGPFTFTIGDTSSLSPYVRGGYAVQVKQPAVHNFLPISESLKAPEMVRFETLLNLLTFWEVVSKSGDFRLRQV